MLALGDALAMVLLEVRGFGEDDFLKFHPGGRLGRYLLQRVRDIMRGRGTDADCLSADPGSGCAAFDERASGRSGSGHRFLRESWPGFLPMAILFGRSRKTRRWFPITVERHMVRHPITIQADKLAVEVLNILDQHRIDDLIVVNEKNEPVGIVDSQDLTKLKLL